MKMPRVTTVPTIYGFDWCDDTTRARTRGRNHDAGDRHDTEAAQ